MLHEIFRDVPEPFAFRLWDGTVVALGAGTPAFTVVIHSAATFRRLLRQPTPLTFAEAYVDSAIDLEGDLFAAMHVANTLEEIRLPLARRLRVVFALRP